MKAFIDTSSLFKKYLDEQGSSEFNKLLESVFEIIIAPSTLLEIHSIIERRLREKTLQSEDAKWIEKEFLTDFNFFGVIEWNDELLEKAIRLIRKYQLRVLDSIQLSAAQLSGAALFITSDKQLYKAAKNELPSVTFI
jgi:predicted nucleic acid-binding protein